MSETVENKTAVTTATTTVKSNTPEKVKAKRGRKPKASKVNPEMDFRNYLESLDNKSILHINGEDHPTALFSVDFGEPLEQVELTDEVKNSLMDKMKNFASSFTKKNVRISNDAYNVWWASVI